MNRLALGTAQFGASYGISNIKGKVDVESVRSILEYSWSKGIDTLDTALAYGSSEQNLGYIGIKNWRVVSKLPKLPKSITDVQSWVEDSLELSLQRLDTKKLYGLLLHRPQDLLCDSGRELYEALTRVKHQQKVEKIGISIYSPEELDLLWSHYPVDLVQAPFSIIDRRMETSGWLSRLKDLDVEVHARSIFLQGLLLMESEARPAYFNRWERVWQQLKKWLDSTQVSPLEACLRTTLNQPELDKVLVGVETLAQIKEILLSSNKPTLDSPEYLRCDDLKLINPSNWQLS